MIAYLKGIVTHILPEACFLDVQGVGYRVFIAGSTRSKLVQGQETVLFTYMHVREDAILLYGFHTQDAYELFLHLLGINGIGPKVAMGILSAIEPNAFRLAISQKNMGVLTKLPGIGKKTAERMLLELKDKLGGADGEDDAAVVAEATVASGTTPLDEALQALLALGYSQAEVMPVLKKVAKNQPSVEGIIKAALREFTRGNLL